MLARKNIRNAALFACMTTALPAEAGITDFTTKLASACGKLFQGQEREPQSIENPRVSEDHRIIYGPHDGQAPGNLFTWNNSEERILNFVGKTEELPMAEIQLGEVENAQGLLGQDFVVKYSSSEGLEVSEFGKLVNMNSVNDSWVESIELRTDRNIVVTISVADILELHELNR